jgi:hypothetical protein
MMHMEEVCLAFFLLGFIAYLSQLNPFCLTENILLEHRVTSLNQTDQGVEITTNEGSCFKAS